LTRQRIGLLRDPWASRGLWLDWFCEGFVTFSSGRRAPLSSGPVDAEVLIDYVGNIPNGGACHFRACTGAKSVWAFTDSRSQAEELAFVFLCAGRGVETSSSHSSLRPRRAAFAPNRLSRKGARLRHRRHEYGWNWV